MLNIQPTDFSEIAQRMCELYINYRNNYIEQFADGSYRTCRNDGTFLGTGYITEHLAGRRTFGIREEKAAKVIVFDIDEDNRAAVMGIVRLLMEYAIPENCIHVSLSGRKGYHVACFFDQPIALNQLNIFQACVMIKLTERYPELESLRVDLRPTPQYGVKLPLGVHRATENRCWFCDIHSLKPIETFEYIFTIERIDRSFFDTVVMKKISDENNRNCLAQRAMQSLLRQGTNACRRSPVDESVDKILSEELLMPRTRHDTLLEMCVRLKIAGVHKDACEDILCEWMGDQDDSVYRTPLRECIEDIKDIVACVYENRLRSRSKHRSKGGKSAHTLCLTYGEVKFILSFPNSKMWPVILFIMKYHKVGINYALDWRAHAISSIVKECSSNRDGALSEKTVRSYLAKLCDIGFIHIHTAKSEPKGGAQTQEEEGFTPQNYYYCRYGNHPTEIAVQNGFTKTFRDLNTRADQRVFQTDMRGKSLHDIILDAVNFFEMREELYYDLSQRSYRHLFGNNKKAA